MNGLCDVPVGRHDRGRIEDGPDGLGWPMKGLVFSVDLNVREHDSRTLGTFAPFQNGLKVHGKLVADHALGGGDPFAEGMRIGVVQGHEVPNLWAVAVSDDNAPVHLQEVNNVAHDPRKDFVGIVCVACWRFESVASQRIDHRFPHVVTSVVPVLTLCIPTDVQVLICKCVKGTIHIGRAIRRLR